MEEKLFTKRELDEARVRSFERIDNYFAKRNSTHSIVGIKQDIYNLVDGLGLAKFMKEARYPATYIAQQLLDMDNEKNSDLTEKRKAEFRFGREILAKELGILDQVLEAQTSLLQNIPSRHL